VEKPAGPELSASGSDTIARILSPKLSERIVFNVLWSENERVMKPAA
jgi:hypothetical protein